MPNRTLLIDARRATTLPQLFALVAATHRPIPRNLDGFADFVRETHLDKLVLKGCRLRIGDYKTLADVCADLGVSIETR